MEKIDPTLFPFSTLLFDPFPLLSVSPALQSYSFLSEGFFFIFIFTQVNGYDTY